MPTSLTPAISPETIRQHGLTPDEYEKIKKLLGGREPTLTELGIFSVMWSEHCSYKSSRVHLKRLPTRSKLVLQGPGENAGIIDIGEGWACAFKIESHNHPSFIQHDLRNRPAWVRNHRSPAGHGLDQHQAERFGPGDREK